METTAENTMDDGNGVSYTHTNPLFNMSLSRNDIYSFQPADLKPPKPRRQCCLNLVVFYLILQTALNAFLLYKVFTFESRLSSTRSDKLTGNSIPQDGDQQNDIQTLFLNNTRETKALRGSLWALQTQMNSLSGQDGQLDMLRADLSLLNKTTCNLESKLTTIGPGPPGSQGMTGPPGERGLKGDTGDAGPSGQKGDKGTNGQPGPPGVTGPMGPTGLTGPSGPTGKPGLQGTPGNQGPNAKGDRGEPGTPGLRGDKGDTGPKGSSGTPGPTGEKGDRGLVGPPGPQGNRGDAGPSGQNGDKGTNGQPGPPGVTGPMGPTGLTGPSGPTGKPGLQGAPGNQGPNAKGDRGEPGTPGLRGDKGDTGPKGSSGTPGPTGEKGDRGLVGPPGPQGTSGTTGQKGAQGPPGPTGDRGQKGERGTEQLTVRLVPGPSRGRVEVLVKGAWGTVCDDSFETVDGRVICNMLGYRSITSTFTADQGSGPIWLDDLECTGSETSIFDCRHRGIGQHNCGHQEDVGVQCH